MSLPRAQSRARTGRRIVQKEFPLEPLPTTRVRYGGSMAAVINVVYSSSSIGQIIFDEAPSEFTAARTGGGFRLTLPAKLRMFPAANPESIPMVSNLRGSIYAIGAGGEANERAAGAWLWRNGLNLENNLPVSSVSISPFNLTLGFQGWRRAYCTRQGAS